MNVIAFDRSEVHTQFTIWCTVECVCVPYCAGAQWSILCILCTVIMKAEDAYAADSH